MRLSTAQDLSFQDLPYICLPLFAQVEVEHCLRGGFSCHEISNVNQFISNATTGVRREQQDSLLSKIGDAWVFLVYVSRSELPPEPLVSLSTSLNIDRDRAGLQVEHWTVHPGLTDSVKFSAELLIQRLTYHERIYGVPHTISDKQPREELWPKKQTGISQQESFCELSDLSDGAV